MISIVLLTLGLVNPNQIPECDVDCSVRVYSELHVVKGRVCWTDATCVAIKADLGAEDRKAYPFAYFLGFAYEKQHFELNPANLKRGQIRIEGGKLFRIRHVDFCVGEPRWIPDESEIQNIDWFSRWTLPLKPMTFSQKRWRDFTLKALLLLVR